MILLDPLARPVIGHRGNRAHAPENTIESLREAVALGVDAVEFDLRVSRDGQLVLMHDPTLDRTTSGAGMLAKRTVAELKELDAGARFTADRGRSYPWRSRGVQVPTFDEAVEALPRALPMIIELKVPEAAPLLREAVRRHDLAKRVIVAGFDRNATLPLRGAGFALGASTPDVAALLWPSVRGRTFASLPYEALCIPPHHRGVPLPIGAMVRAIRDARTVLHLWTINDRRAARRYWELGVQGIISDDPGVMLEERGR